MNNEQSVAESLDLPVDGSIDWSVDDNPEHTAFTVGEDYSEEEVETEEVEDEVESDEDEEQDVLEDEEDDTEEEADEEDTAEEDSDTSQQDEVRDNLKRAMQSERTKRKEATERVAALEQELAFVKGSSTGEDYNALVAQIKELGLEDVLDVKEKQSLDPRVQQMLDAQAQVKQQEEQAAKFTQFTNDMQSEVTANVGSYSNIDVKNSQQGEALANMIIASVVQGAELEDAVESNMKILDNLLKAKNKPAVTPRRKVKAATKTTASAKQRVSKQKQKEGNFDDVFLRAVSGFSD